MRMTPGLPRVLKHNFLNTLIVGLLTVLYGPILIHWCDGWLNKSIGIEHEYFSHGLIGLPYAAYVVWKQRQAWQNLEDKTHPLGALLLGLAAIFYLTGLPDLVYLSFPCLLAGICLWFKGIPGLKLQGFPLVLVLLATPNSIPYLLTPYTLPLQKFIAAAAGFLLMQLGLNVTVEEIYLAVNGRFVEVAPYCAGLKMLFTSLYVSLMLLHWTGNLQNLKKTTLLLTGAVFISVGANIIRNTLLSWLHGMGNESGFEILHEGWGGDLYSVAMLMAIVGLLKMIDRSDRFTEPEISEEEGGVHE
jgi:cyanoexosortase B